MDGVTQRLELAKHVLHKEILQQAPHQLPPSQQAPVHPGESVV
jgi:hypothetical protein